MCLILHVNTKGRVMVDYDAFFQYGYGGTDGQNGALRPNSGGTGCGCNGCQENKGLAARYRTRFDDKKFANSHETWDDEQYLIFLPRVLGYIPQQKQWAQLQVNRLELLGTGNETTAWESRLRLASIEHEKSKRGRKSKAF